MLRVFWTNSESGREHRLDIDKHCLSQEETALRTHLTCVLKEAGSPPILNLHLRREFAAEWEA